MEKSVTKPWRELCLEYLRSLIKLLSFLIIIVETVTTKVSAKTEADWYWAVPVFSAIEKPNR